MSDYYGYDQDYGYDYYMTDIDIAKQILYEVNIMLARFTEWFCGVDSNIYNNKKELLKYTEGEETIQYTKSFNAFNIQIIVHGGDYYLDSPKTSFYKMENTLKIYTNINQFFYRGIYPFKSAGKKAYKKLTSSEEYDKAYEEFHNKELAIEKYRTKILNSMARFSISFLSNNGCRYNKISSKSGDAFLTEKLNRLLYGYNKIISLNTLPGMGEVYFAILSVEDMADKNYKDNPFWLRCQKAYLDYKTLYFLRKHVFELGMFKYQIKTGGKIDKEYNSKNMYIKEIDERFMYTYFVADNNILVLGAE